MGTKSSSFSGSPAVQGAPAAGGFFQMLIALVVVAAIMKVVLPKFASKMTKGLRTDLNSELKVMETAAFAGGNLYIVQAKGKTLLLSAHTTGINCLADLTDAPAEPAPQTFKEMIDAADITKLTEEISARAVVEVPAEDDEISQKLHRLQRLMIK